MIQYIDKHNPERHPSYGIKFVVIFVMACLLMIGTAAIGLMSRSRENTNNEVASEIVGKWGDEVSISGPFIVDSVGHGYESNQYAPASLNCVAEIKSNSLHRGIYQAEAYDADISLKGAFNSETLNPDNKKVYLKLYVPVFQCQDIREFKLNGKSLDYNRAGYYIYAKVNNSDLMGNPEFSIDFSIRGSQQISIEESGDFSSITIKGNAIGPSFDGYSLPQTRKIDGRDFIAVWVRNSSVGNEDTKDYVAIAKFLTGVDSYTKVTRSLKYAFLIIILTFVCVLLTEFINRLHIPPVNYLLIGLALIIFYSLLLSFTELMAFGFAYLIAAVMTVALITIYLWKMLSSSKLGMMVGAVLSGLYAACYVMLSAENYALLFGSLLLFAALGGLMYGSLKISRKP